MQQSETAPAGASRLDRIRNYQSHEFWTILAMRPLAIALLLLVADLRWVTPNRLTLASFVCFVLSAALIAFGGPSAFVAAAILINVANVFDNADGTLARYRRCGTSFGSFFDKMCDAIGWILVGTAVGWSAWRATGQPIYLLLGPSSASFLIARGYSKWVEHAQNVARMPARSAPDAAAAAPPRRTGADWVRLLVEAFSRVYWFDEVDLSFWIALFLILDRVAALAWVLAVSQAVGMVIAMVRRAWRMHKLDTARA
jgi:phosphatidylglycerophosphate synthase